MIYFKQSSGPVRAIAKADKVLQYRELTPGKVSGLRQKYNSDILGTPDYWQTKKDSRYAVLIWLKDVRKIDPVKIAKTNQLSWIVLNGKDSFGLP